MQVIAYDFETTGVDPRSCEPVQVAGVKATIHDDGSFTTEGKIVSYLKIKAKSIPEGAYRVHGISKEITEMKGRDPLDVVPLISGTVLGYNNRSYDDVILNRYGGDIQGSIDLYVGTARLKKKGVLERATLSASYETLTGKEAVNAHDALSDVQMTLELIQPMMKVLGFEHFQELVDYLGQPMGDVNMLMPFGKHKGTKLSDLPSSYVRWLKSSANTYGDLKASLELL